MDPISSTALSRLCIVLSFRRGAFEQDEALGGAGIALRQPYVAGWARSATASAAAPDDARQAFALASARAAILAAGTGPVCGASSGANGTPLSRRRPALQPLRCGRSGMLAANVPVGGSHEADYCSG